MEQMAESPSSDDNFAANLRAREQEVRSLEERVAQRTKELELANEQLARTRQRLQQASLRLRSIVDSTDDSICVIDTSYQLMVFNRAYAKGFEERFGYPPESGMNVLEAFRDDPLLYERVTGWWARALQGESYSLQREKMVQGDEKRYYDVRFTPLRDERGRQTGAVSVTREITHVKRTEERLSEANSQLHRAVHALEIRNRELQDFAYVASHDLREPIRKIRTFAGLVLGDYSDRLDEDGRMFLSRVDKASRRMMSLLDDLLAFSRIQTHAEAFQPVHLEQVAREAIAYLEEEIEEAGAVVDIEMLPKVTADPAQIRQLFLKLIGNSIKFRQPDVPPSIRISGSETEVHRKQAVRVAIEDNGIGFEAHYAKQIFSPFERLHGRSRFEGTGMGLAIAKRIVERHGGRITARSTIGKGSVFEITLPVEPEPETITSPARA